MKHILTFILIGTLLLCCAGCVAAPQITAAIDVPATSDDANLDIAENPQPQFEGFKDLSLDERALFTTNEWIELTEDNIFNHSDFIFEGEITNATEHSAVSPQIGVEHFFTALEVGVDKVYYQADPTAQMPSTVRLHYPITSKDADYSTECPQAGDRAVFFAGTTQDIVGIPLSEFAPFCIRDFNRTDIRIENGSYMVDEVFLSLNDKMANPINSDLYAAPTPVEESSFESKLFDAIEKYKK